MLRKALYLLAVVSVVVLMVALGGSQEIKGPRIEIDESNFDFGFAPEGTFMVHEYVIRNIGDEPLIIKRVRTTCGCTSAPVKKTKIDPGDSTTITIIFNSTRYFHKTSKAAIISTNDPTRPSEKITFIANMDTTSPRAITPEPRKINLGKGDTFKKTDSVFVQNISEQPVTLKLVDYYKEYLKEPVIKSQANPQATGEVTIKPGEKAVIVVSVRDDIPPAEIVRASFTVAALDANGKEVTRITVPVFGITK